MSQTFKTFFCICRAALEHEQVASIDWSEWRVIVLLAAFTLTLFTYYTITPIVMKVTSAMAINLSLLTADFYTLVIGVLLFQFKVSQCFSQLFNGVNEQIFNF
jgi:solute carrier family 35 protein F1/2